MTDQFVIVDTKCGKRCNLYQGGHDYYISWIVTAFTSDLRYAKLYDSVEKAQRDCDRFTREKFEFDGNTSLGPGRLRVMKVALVPVEQGG